MLKQTAYLVNRKLKNTFIYNYLARLYYLSLDVKKIIIYGTTDMFDEVCIETTSLCNRKCSYCPVSKYDRGHFFMEKNLFQRIINDLVKLRFRGDIVHHFYAEPLLDKRLEGFIEYEKKKLPECAVRLYSNGDLLTEKKIKKLVGAGVTNFYITLHQERSTEHFSKVYDSLSQDVKKKFYIRAMSQDSILSSRAGLVKVKHKEVKKFCGFPSNNVVIDVHGNFVLCCEDYFGNNKWGNIKEESIMEIWKKPKFRRLRRDTMRGKFELSICEHCTNKDI